MLVKEDLKIVAWPERNPIQGGFKSIDEVTNRGLIVPIAENEPVTEPKLAPLGAGAGLAPTIPAGMRAISVRVNEVIGVAGFVIPGSRVDLVVTVNDPNTKGTITKAVVSNLEVLTAGSRFDQEASRAEGKPIRANVVTLLATPQDAEKIGLAASEGSITLTLRNPLDVMPTQTDGARLASSSGQPVCRRSNDASRKARGSGSWRRRPGRSIRLRRSERPREARNLSDDQIPFSAFRCRPVVSRRVVAVGDVSAQQPPRRNRSSVFG
jgi:pilus assembly protein CpaB